MNPLTLVKRTQKITSTEAALGISDEASWHAKYKDSAYVFVGGLSYDLTEGDLLAVFSQYPYFSSLSLSLLITVSIFLLFLCPNLKKKNFGR